MDPVRAALLRALERRCDIGDGELVFPAVPAVLDHYVELVAAHFGQRAWVMSPEERVCLREALGDELRQAFAAAPGSKVHVRYEHAGTTAAPIPYEITGSSGSIAGEYDTWVTTREGSLFGTYPDAKVMDVARTLGPALGVPALDVGAGTGRNALPLARAGHPTVALELSPVLAEVLAGEVAKAPLDVRVVCGNIFDEALELPLAPFELAIVAEVISHLRDAGELRRLFVRLASLLAPGGVLVASSFLAKDGYDPDDVARQVAEVILSSFFTREEVASATANLPWELVSDESAIEYERDHLPGRAWPPTRWYESWASGSDAFDMTWGTAPIELRWLVFRRG
jgi:SAM-dependent methyltransferase